MEQFESRLNPLPIAISMLSELDSDQFLEIIHRSGVSIDLNLTKAESYSHKTRIRAYIPLLNKQIRNMDNSAALHAIYLVSVYKCDILSPSPTPPLKGGAILLPSP